MDVSVGPEMDDLVKVQRFALQNFKSPDATCSAASIELGCAEVRKYQTLDQVIDVLESNPLTQRKTRHYEEVRSREKDKQSTEILLTIFEN